MRTPLIMGNWKMNLLTPEIKDLSESVKKHNRLEVDVVLFPPFGYLSFVSDVCGSANGSVKVGAQTASEHDMGAYTGEMSTSMLKDLGCSYVLVGHSERRTIFSETDQMVLKKVKKVLSEGMTAVLCIGETLEQRKSSEVEKVLSTQLQCVLNSLTEDEAKLLVIAYEPVWAIGTGLAATSNQVQDVHAYIRKIVSGFDIELAKTIKIVYGGSLKPSNAKEILGLEDVDGGLIGGASLKSDDFAEIINIALCEKN
jgi:triosephosphate isomerase (TIM)